MRLPIILDTDPGIDDAAAIAAALLLDGDYPVLSSYLGSIRRYLHEAEGQNGREAAVCAQS